MTDWSETPDIDDLRRQARAWVIRIRSGDATAADTAALVRWRALSPDHAQALSDAIQLRRQVADAGRSSGASAAVYDLRQPAAPRPMIGRRAFLGGAIAASVGGVMVIRPPLDLWPSLAELRSDYRTGVGERRTIDLAWGVSVQLNTKTSIAINSDDRAYHLSLIAGEAAAQADASARPVVIAAGGGEASTRTGRFSVRLDGAKTCVTCLEGAVDVAHGRGATFTLAAGRQFTYGEGADGEIIAIDPMREAAWRRGLLIFNDEPLIRVVDEINRYRSGKIILTNADLGRIPVNAVFQLDRIDRAVSQIRQVASATVTTLPGGVVLLS